MKTAIALRHVAFEDLGLLAGLLRTRGYDARYVEVSVDDLGAVDPLGPDLLVVLGGPIGAYQDAQYPFLKPEVALLRRRLEADRPTFGICLGAQLMARALGARVYPGAAKEIGWAPLSLTPAGAASCLAHVAAEATPVLHWHGDTFDLPAGAERLASTALTENQAFRWGKAALALQFHVEVTARGLEQWFVGHTLEIATTPGVSVERLRADTARHATVFEAQGAKCLGAWLDEVEGRSI